MTKKPTISVRVDAKLVRSARKSARAKAWTPRAQFELWAQLGRLGERVLSHDSIVKLKALADAPEIDRPSAHANTKRDKRRKKSTGAGA